MVDNSHIRFKPMGLNSDLIKWYEGRKVIVYTYLNREWKATEGQVIKAARVNITVEYDPWGTGHSITANFRRDTQHINSGAGLSKVHIRTLEQDDMDAQAKWGLESLANAGVSLDHDSHLSADQIVALATTVRNHHSFLSGKE